MTPRASRITSILAAAAVALFASTKADAGNDRDTNKPPANASVVVTPTPNNLSIASSGQDAPASSGEMTYILSGEDHVRKGEYSQAIADFSTAINLAPNNAIAWNDRGYAYFENWHARGDHAIIGELDNAKTDLEKALKISPNYNRAKVNLMFVCAHSADVYVNSGDYHRANENYKGALQFDSNNAPVVSNYSFSLAKEGFAQLEAGNLNDASGLFAAAVKYGKKAVELKHKNGPSNYAYALRGDATAAAYLGVAAESNGVSAIAGKLYSTALQELTESISIKSDPETFSVRAMLELKLGQLQAAFDDANAVLASGNLKNDLAAKMHYVRAAVEQKSNKPQEANNDIAKAGVPTVEVSRYFNGFGLGIPTTAPARQAQIERPQILTPKAA